MSFALLGLLHSKREGLGDFDWEGDAVAIKGVVGEIT